MGASSEVIGEQAVATVMRLTTDATNLGNCQRSIAGNTDDEIHMTAIRSCVMHIFAYNIIYYIRSALICVFPFLIICES